MYKKATVYLITYYIKYLYVLYKVFVCTTYYINCLYVHIYIHIYICYGGFPCIADTDKHLLHSNISFIIPYCVLPFTSQTFLCMHTQVHTYIHTQKQSVSLPLSGRAIWHSQNARALSGLLSQCNATSWSRARNSQVH